MINYVGILPYAYEPYYKECSDTLRLSKVEAIDNTQDNIGVPESWNRGIDLMCHNDADWLIILSASMRFGEKGGTDILNQIEKHQYAQVIHFAEKDIPLSNFVRGETMGREAGFSWHCIALRRDVLDKVGYFDPNFYPIYFEDVDYDLRINKAFPDRTWLVAPIDATDAGYGHGAKLGGVKSPSEPLIAYFATKWGRHPSATKLGSYDHPFDDENNSVAFFPPAHGRVWYEQKN